MSGRKRSNVWTYYRESEEDRSKVKCTICDKMISRGGSGRKGSSSALSNHLKLKHAMEYTNLERAVCRVSSNTPDDEAMQQEPVAAQDVQPSTSGTQPSNSKTFTTTQSTLEDSFISKWKIDDPRSVPITKSIAEMIAVDNQPISVVEDKGFNRLMQLVKPKYQMPSRKHVGETVIPQLYEQLKKTIQDELSKTNTVSVTSDMWTNLNNLFSFLSFTIHWLDDEFTLQHRVLQMKSFSGQHNADNIRTQFVEIADVWQIMSKIHIILTDSGSNMVKAVRDSPFNGQKCFLHILQRVILEALQVQQEVDEAIAQGRKIVSHFNHSTQAQEKFSKIQEELNLPKHKLVQDVITRWNSKYYMCARLEEQKRAISLYISDNSGSINIQNLSEREWMLLQHCLVLLQPFEEITKKVSSTYSCISEVIPHTKILQKFLIKEEVQRTCSYVDSLRMALKEGLERRVGQFEDEKNYTIATLLDPRYKMNFFTPEKVPWVRRQFLAEYVRRSADMDSTSNSENESEPPAPLPYSGLQSQEGTHKALWTCYEELASAKQPEIEEPKSPIAIELDRYIADSLLSRDMCPYKWWSKNKFRFPLMSNMAKIFLSAPGSSVYSERLFSEAGNVYEQKRNKLLPNKAEHLVFLHHNLPLVNFKY